MNPLRCTLLSAALAPLLVACNGAEETTATATASTATASTATASTASMATASTLSSESDTATGETTAAGGGVEGLELMTELGGLWSGPATKTPLGAFPLMNMDFRAIDPRTIFGRVDLDAANNLRFGLAVETHGGEDVLVYRNGGYFLGILRDSRTVLKDHDPVARSWHFCSLDKGCEYIDALFSFPAEDAMILDVKVMGQPHVYWDAKRVEARTLPEPFPADDAPVGDGSNPFPAMPTLDVEVRWLVPLEADGEAWVILSEGPCDLQGSCHHSRSLRIAAPAGSNSVTLHYEQIHSGAYRMNAILDRNGNMAETGFPDSGDGISAPNAAVNVKEEGESSAVATIVLDL